MPGSRPDKKHRISIRCENVDVYKRQTLDRPVHAMNLEMYANYIRMYYSNYVVVAIDASVGRKDHVGYATIGRGALKPGLGVSKELEAVGDISITGIVGGCSSLDPVSYTHLDVYKRQFLCCLLL